jgi:hypothetical protein
VQTRVTMPTTIRPHLAATKKLVPPLSLSGVSRKDLERREWLRHLRELRAEVQDLQRVLSRVREGSAQWRPPQACKRAHGAPASAGEVFSSRLDAALKNVVLP